MIKISQKKIRSLSQYLPKLPDSFFIGVDVKNIDEQQLKKVGFSLPLVEGSSVLPSSIGSVSEKNANGDEVKLKDLPKVKKAFYVDTSWKDWRGNTHYGTVTRYKAVYQIEFIPPQEERMIVYHESNLEIIGSTLLSKDNEERVLHVVNLFLECFSECVFFDQKLKSINIIKKLNWEILPQGTHPWETLKPYIEKRLNTLTENTQNVIKERFDYMYSLKPDFTAVGIGGFSGYVVFAVNDVFILESMESNNATYIFDSKWEDMSQLTKTEIINNNLHKARIVHNKSWKHNIRRSI